MGLKQTLRMTPQLQQAIKLLQLSRMELSETIRKELEENPVLEENMEREDDGLSAKQESEDNADPLSGTDQDPPKADEFEWESYLDGGNKMPQSGGSGNEEIMNYENMISTETTLNEHLMWQVKMSGFNEEEEYFVTLLVSSIDEDGYLKIPLEQIAEDEQVDKDELESLMPFIHEFDPPGVGARNLKECLLIQAQHLEEDTHDFVRLIENHLKDLETKNYLAIAKEMGLEVEDVIELCQTVYSMDPKPGRQFHSGDTHYVTPDVYVYKVGDEHVISLNEDGLPRLKISNFYKGILQGKDDKQDNKKTKKQATEEPVAGKAEGVGGTEGVGGDTQDYIQDKLKSAVWLIKSIHQRQRTIYKVAESIVKKQKDFFEKGPAHIKPMILKDVANDIGMHESTVSRVTTSKYMHSPQGIFELKYFFNSGISKTDGESLASESVKIKIKNLVENEDPKSPLSDQKLVDLLKADGIKIARRTVAKYRDMLKISPSSKRKKFY